MKWKTTNLLMSLVFLFSVQFIAAQEMVYNGNVTDLSGEALIGANVNVLNSTNGTITDLDGKFIITANMGDILVISYIGYSSKEMTLGTETNLNFTLSEGEDLDEVVITALGISREKKALGYAVQEIDGSSLETGNEANFINTLSGKVSGIQVMGGQGIGGSSRILIRGANSILGENQPLFVVDGVPIDNSNYASSTQQYGNRDSENGNADYGNAAQDINPNDIESVSVLKGPNAAALYGSRGANGVILITTKKGKKGKANIEVNFGGTYDNVWDMPPLQNEYGGGRTAEFEIGTDGIPMQNVTTDESWGPKLDGQQVRQWDGTGSGGEVRAWEAHPNNYKDFFQTGFTRNTNIAVSGGTENSTYRISMTNRDQKGIVPNSSLKNNTISLNLGTKVNKLSVSTSLNYYNRTGKGRPSQGSGSDNITYNMVIWTQRQIDIERLRDYENIDGSQKTWRTSGFNSTYVRANNPFWLAYKDVQTDRKDRLIGNISATYQVTDNFNIMARAGQDWYVDNRHDVRAVGSRYTPYYIHDDINYRQESYDLFANFNDRFGNISFDATVGTSLWKEQTKRIKSSTNGGLNISDIYTLGNSIDPPTIKTYFPRKETQSVFATASFGYNNFLYLDLTGRNDWSSTLPEANNSYFYPSVTGSVVFSELLDVNAISFGKFRFGWAQVGKDTDPYRIEQTYYPGLPVGGNPTFTLPSSLNNANLLPEITSSIEAGLELKMFKNRVGLDLTVYSSTSKNQILPITVSPTTLYSSKWVNAGEISNKGVELGLNGDIFKSSDFGWNMGINWAKNVNKIVSLPDGIESILHANFYGSGYSRVFLESRVGEPFSSIYATKIATDANGNPIVRGPDSSNPGTWLPAEKPEFIGSILPKWTAGFYNDFNYKNFNLSVLLDMQQGGVIFLRGYQTALYAGTMLETTEGGIRENGVVLDGVLEDGSKNTQVLDAKTYSRLKRRTPGDHTVFDASFVKLREVSLGYNLPNLFGGKYFTNARLSLVGRNLAILHRNTPKGYDPESAGNSSGNLQGREYGQLPTYRSLGFNLSLKF